MSEAQRNERGSSDAGVAPLADGGVAHFDAACGRCGYSTRGLTTLVCPECGGDFRQVGLVASPAGAGRTRRLGSRAIRAAIDWTIAAVLMWCALVPAVENVLPLRRAYDNSFVLKSEALIGREYHLTARDTTWDAEPPAMQVTVNWTPAAGARPRMFVFDPATGNFHDFTAGAANPTPLNPTTLLAWMAAGGANATDPKIVTEVQRLIGWILRASRPYTVPWTAGRNMSSGSSRGSGPFAEATVYRSEGQRPPGAQLIVTLALVAAWVAGLRAIWRLRRTSAAEAKDEG